MSTVDEKRQAAATAEDAGRAGDAGQTAGDAGQTADLSTAPAQSAVGSRPGRPGRGPLGLLRHGWRQLTSMRTALVLLFLLAVAAVPGSVLPQRGLNQLKVDDYYAEHPDLAPILDRLYAFDAFAAPWFAAVYLALFVSLVGCLVPRVRLHARALVRRPPPAPRHLDKLPHSADVAVGEDADPATVIEAARRRLRRTGWRTTVRTTGGTVALSAEKGYLRETGNLVFHLALVALLLGLAAGGLWGWKATAVVAEGDAFCNTVQGYDQWTPGRMVGGEDLPPFCVELEEFRGRYTPTGQPVRYTADVRYDTGDPDRSQPFRIGVNNPLRLDTARIYLINHGYAPVLRYTDRFGESFESPAIFLPQDQAWTSEGVAVFAEANQDPAARTRSEDVQVAFAGILTPTTPEQGVKVRSLHPEQISPGLTLIAYRGDTGLNTGVPRSVYALDPGQIQSGALKPAGTAFLTPGQTWRLDDGTEVTWVGTREWASFQVGHDPGQVPALVAAGLVVLGLLASLVVRRRRFWLVASPARPGDEQGRTVVRAGGLARADSGRHGAEFREIVRRIEE